MIKIVEIKECKDSLYIKPKTVLYEQKKTLKRWDVVDTHDSVAILLYHKEKETFVLVKQFRPAIYLKNNCGYTYELCAGLVDKDKDIKQIAKEEIEEETGYNVPFENIEKITSFYTAVGFAGGNQTLYYAEINESMKINEGGGIEHEDIEVIYIPLNEAKTFMYDETKAKTPGLLFSFMWFFENFSKLHKSYS